MSRSTVKLANWIAAARDGSDDALGESLEACRAYLLLVARQEIDPALMAKAGASDLVQETFLEAQRDFGSRIPGLAASNTAEQSGEFPASLAQNGQTKGDSGSGQRWDGLGPRRHGFRERTSHAAPRPPYIAERTTNRC